MNEIINNAPTNTNYKVAKALSLYKQNKEFIRKNKIACVPLTGKNGNKAGWTDWTCKESKKICKRYTGNIGYRCDKFMVVDCDTYKKNWGFDDLITNDILDSTFVVKSASGGWHIYYLIDDRMSHWMKKVNIGKKEIDIQINKGCYIVAPGSKFEDKSYNIYNESSINRMPDSLFEAIDKYMQCPTPKKIIEYKALDTKDTDKILDLIDPEFWTARDSWMKIASAMKYCGYSCDVFDSYSRKGGSSYGETNEMWQSCKPERNDGCKMGTLVYYAQLSNKEKTEKVLKSDFIFEEQYMELTKLYEAGYISNYMIAKLFYTRYIDTFTYSHGNWYRMNEYGIYIPITHDTQVYFARAIMNYIQPFLIKCINKEAIENKVKRKALWGACAKIEQAKFKKDVFEELKGLFLDNEFNDKVNQCQHLVGFTNGVYDLTTMKFRNGKRDEYVSLTTGYDYNPEKCTSDMKFIEDVLRGYFKETDAFEYNIKFLASLLHGGNPLETVHFWVGRGRNGKGTTDQLLQAGFGNYYATIDTSYYTCLKRAGSTGVEILALQNKRIGMTSELDTSGQQSTWYTSKFNGHSGGDKLESRYNYGNEMISFKPTFKPIVQCNDMPKFHGGSVEGAALRCDVQKYIYTFRKPETYNPKDPTHKKVDTTLKDKLPLMGMAFMHVLFKWYPIFLKDGLVQPVSVKESTEEYRKDIDTVKVFLNETIESRPGDDNKIPIKDLYAAYQLSGDVPMTKQSFVKRIEACGYTTKRMNYGKAVLNVTYTEIEDTDEILIETNDLDTIIGL